MIKGGKGGGNTTTGLHFEQRTDIKQLFEQIDGYEIKNSTNKTGYEIWFKKLTQIGRASCRERV